MSEAALSFLGLGMPITRPSLGALINSGFELLLSGAPGLRFPVELREVAQVGDPVTQTFKVTVSMRAPDGLRVLPGMTAIVTATFRRAEILGERILIPVASVGQQDAQSVVWIVDAQQKAARRNVKLGGVTGGSVEILEGLKPQYEKHHDVVYDDDANRFCLAWGSPLDGPGNRIHGQYFTFPDEVASRSKLTQNRLYRCVAVSVN